MSGQGRRAVLPPAGHRSEPPLASDGLTVTVTNKAGYSTSFDFAELPVAAAMQGSLAAAFAAQSRGWTSHLTAQNNWAKVRLFTAFLSGLDSHPMTWTD